MHPGAFLARATRWTLLPLLLAACGGVPPQVPDRVTYPRDDTSPPAPVEAIGEDEPVPLESVDASLFDAVRDALARGDWLAATLALPRKVQTPPPGAPGAVATAASEPGAVAAPGAATALWIDYYAARIALLRGDLRGHGETLATLLSSPIPRALQREVLHHLLTTAELRGDAREQLRLAQALAAAGGHPERSPAECNVILWRAAQQLAARGDTPPAGAPDADLEGWLDLARAAQLDRAEAVADALNAWEAQYPGHAAADLAASLRDGALADAATTQLAVVLPLSGPLAAAGDAVTRGLVAAHFDSASGEIGIEIIDSRRVGNAIEALDAARAIGAAVTVGPLGKLQVGEVLEAAPADMPVLALNRPEAPAAAATVLQLSLAPDDEAVQLAERVFASGARRALLIRPADAWGDRIEVALRSRWEALGGQLPARAAYTTPAGYSNTIRDALALDASAQRSAALRSLFAESVETSGRRRDDLDAVFLLTRSADEARALKPLVDYHYAGDLPVYALSTADGGGTDSSRNRDLEGLRLLVMPWRLQPGSVPGLGTGEAAGSFDALHALGADAYRLARRWWQLRSAAAPDVAGLTADLHRDEYGVLQRRLRLAEFDRGALRPL